MPTKSINIILLFFVVFVLLSEANLAIALEVNYPNILGHSLNPSSSFPEYVCYFFGLGLNLAILAAILTIAFGGVYYLVDYGTGKFTSEAKEWIKSGILGLLIVICASLIAYTINPSLTTCKFGVLSFINFIPSPGGPTTSTGAQITTYQEIPIGILTENLLTRTMDCYGFNQWGDPVDGDPTTPATNILEPTYLNHDRADCITQLADGAQKKAQLIASLSDEITKLMSQCSCAGKCDPSCDPSKGGCQVQGACQPGGSCGGSCVGATCIQPPSTNDCCPTDSGVKDPKNPTKNLSVKDLIEHGPIGLSININSSSGSCSAPVVNYNGLDEFRCPNLIPGDHSSCNDVESFVETTKVINGRAMVIIDQQKWNKLNMLQQLTYFQIKIKEIEQKVKDDKDVLDQAKATLGRCYLAIPYVDLLKTYKNTNQTQNIILTQDNFTDPQTGNQINVSKYCAGFNYNNSSCFKKCNDACPDTSPAAINSYKTGNIKNAYNNRPCIYGNNTSFGACISSCQNDCLNVCSQKYLSCSDDYKFCANQCNNNSQCILNNSDKCLFNNTDFQNCANQATDQGNANYCINRAYFCKNGSDEYAGYSDCTTPASGCSPDQYSASYLYDNKNCQKCSDPYKPANKSSICYSKTSSTATCQQVCPETAKCPTGSKCPNCPCDQISDPTDPTKPLAVSFSVPNINNGSNAGNEGYYTASQPILAHQMVGPQCNGYSYNDDPLTFYCQDNWWNDPNREGLSPTPIGQERVCSKSSEVPVGQTVDSAEKWANDLIKSTDAINQDMQKIFDQAIKAGNAYKTSPIQNYCKCNAKLESNSPICKTGCQFNYQLINVPILDGAGNLIGMYQQPVCSCIFIPCNGTPCQQVSDYLSQIWNIYRQLKLDFIDFYTTMLKEPRSDIMKELTYSRQATSSCSLVNSAHGADTRLLSCTRVGDEIMSPISSGKITYNNQTINGYCYGAELGELFNESLTDNWFCCQQYDRTSTTAK